MTGATLSHYRIISELGRGGMGIVYLAEDTKLDRQVAIKVLPSSTLASDDDRARFYREAKAAAALNHPNIAQIYQIDEAVPSDAPHGTQPSPFIAMEYIDGEPLHDRIAAGPLPLKDAVRVAQQIAGALDAAHDAEIVHRDIKSANVILTSKGDAKVLDFGLAQTAASTKLTRMGSTLGTVAYMSPEQARGEEVDRRTDLWALGVVLYEMVAGRNPFGGDYEQAVVYSILNTDPEPLTAVRTGVPMELERIINKCLSKEADFRYQSATDLLVDLKAIEVRGGSGAAHGTAAHSVVSGHGLSAAPAAAITPATSRSAMLWMAGIVGALLVGLVIGWMLSRQPEGQDRPAMAVSLVVPDAFDLSHPTISPDGRYVAFTANGGRLMLRDLTLGTHRSIIETGDNADVRISRFSPDGRWLVFEHGSEGLSIVQVSGGTVAALSADGTTPSWIDNDNLVYSDGESIYRMSRVTQRVETIWSPTEGEGVALTHPETIPGTDIILVSMITEGNQRVGLLDMETGAVEPLIDDAIAGRYVRSGHIVFTEQDAGLDYSGRVFAQPFDLAARETRGPAVPVLSERGYWEFGLNARGDLVTSGGVEERGAAGATDVFILDPDTGEQGPVLRSIPPYDAVAVSPDASWYAYSVTTTNELIVGPMDQSQGGAFHFQSDRFITEIEFSPDVEEIYYAEGFFPAGMGALKRSLTAGGQAEDVDFGGYQFEIVIDFTADGSSMLLGYGDTPEEFDFFLRDLETDETTLLDTGPDVQSASISPDGRYLAYAVSPGPISISINVLSVDGRGPWRVASGFGLAEWSPDGEALYIRDDNSIYRLPLTMQGGVRAAGDPELLYTGTTDLWYTVNTATGDLIVVDRLSSTDRPLDRLDLILNWGERLKIEAPVR